MIIKFCLVRSSCLPINSRNNLSDTYALYSGLLRRKRRLTHQERRTFCAALLEPYDQHVLQDRWGVSGSNNNPAPIVSKTPHCAFWGMAYCRHNLLAGNRHRATYYAWTDLLPEFSCSRHCRAGAPLAICQESICRLFVIIAESSDDA